MRQVPEMSDDSVLARRRRAAERERDVRHKSEHEADDISSRHCFLQTNSALNTLSLTQGSGLMNQWNI